MSRSLGGILLTTRSPMAISPSEISSSPAIIRRSVDLPHPDGPTSTQNSPSAMPISTPRITCVDPKRLCTARMATPAMLFLMNLVELHDESRPHPFPLFHDWARRNVAVQMAVAHLYVLTDAAGACRRRRRNRAGPS